MEHFTIKNVPVKKRKKVPERYLEFANQIQQTFVFYKWCRFDFNKGGPEAGADIS